MVSLILQLALDGAALAADPLPEPVGKVLMVPTQLPVHEKVTFQVVYVVGPGGLSAGDAIRVEDPVFHGMRWAKGWAGRPGVPVLR